MAGEHTDRPESLILWASAHFWRKVDGVGTELEIALVVPESLKWDSVSATTPNLETKGSCQERDDGRMLVELHNF